MTDTTTPRFSHQLARVLLSKPDLPMVPSCVSEFLGGIDAVLEREYKREAHRAEQDSP